MPKIKTSADDLLTKVLGLFSFEFTLKTLLKVGDRFLDTDNALKTVTARGVKGDFTFLSYEDCQDIDILDKLPGVPPLVVMIVRPKENATKTEVPEIKGEDILASFSSAPVPMPSMETSSESPPQKIKKGVAVRPE